MQKVYLTKVVFQKIVEHLVGFTLLTFCFSAQLYADSVTWDVETAIVSNPEFYPSSESEYLFEQPEFINTTDHGGVPTIESFFELVRRLNPSVLPDPILIPIGVGDITTFIPVALLGKQVGDAFVQYNYIRSQVHALLGVHLIDASDYSGSVSAQLMARQQIEALYQNALGYSQNQSVQFGVPLSYVQQANISVDMIWPEVHTVLGEQVLVPVLYLSPETINTRRIDNHAVVFDGDVTFEAINILSGTISLSRDAFLKVKKNLYVAEGASLEAKRELRLVVEGTLWNISGSITAPEHMDILAGGIELHTYVHPFKDKYGWGSRFGEVGIIDSEAGDIVIRTYDDINVVGGGIHTGSGDVSISVGFPRPGEELTDPGAYIGAGSNIERMVSPEGESLGISDPSLSGGANTPVSGFPDDTPVPAVQLNLNYGGNFSLHAARSIFNTRFGDEDGWQDHSESETAVLQSFVSTDNGVIEILSANEIVIDGGVLIADKGHITLMAKQGVFISGSEEEYSQYRSNYISDTDQVHIQQYRTSFIRSALDAGQSITIASEFGDVILQGASLNSQQGSLLSAKNGEVNFLIAREHGEYFNQSVDKNSFRIKEVDFGRDVDSPVYTVIRGGVAVDALYGLNVEFTSRGGRSVDSQVIRLSKIEGLEWLATIENHPDLPEGTWSEVHDLTNRHWNDVDRTMTQELRTLIAIIVTVATRGQGASIVGAVQGSTFAAVANAGFTALMTQIATLQANAALNGRVLEPDELYDELSKSESVDSLLNSILTAGVMHSLPSGEFEAWYVGRGENYHETARRGFALIDQSTDIVIRSLAEAGIKSAIIDNTEAFNDDFLSNLIRNSISSIGMFLTQEIIENSKDLNSVSEYLAHASTSCVTAGLSADFDNSASFESACGTAAGTAAIYRLLEEHTLGSLRAEQQELADWLEGTFGGVLLIEDESEIAAYINSGQASIETLYYLGEFFEISNKITDLSSKFINLSTLWSATGAFVAGFSADNIQIISNTIDIQGRADSNVDQNIVRNALVIQQFLYEHKILEDIVGRTFPAGYLEDLGYLPEGYVDDPNTEVSGALFTYIRHLYDLGIEPPPEAQEDTTTMRISNKLRGSIDWPGLREVAFNEGVPQSLAALRRDIDLRVSEGVTNGDELNWFYNELSRNFSNIQQISNALAYYAPSGVVLRIGAIATRELITPVVRRLDESLRFGNFKFKYDEFVDSLVGVADSQKNLLRADFQRDRQLYGILKDSPEAFEIWKVLASRNRAFRTSKNILSIKSYLNSGSDDTIDSILVVMDGLKPSRKQSFLNGLSEVANNTSLFSSLSSSRLASPQEVADVVSKLRAYRGDNNIGDGNLGYVDGIVNGASVDSKVWSSVGTRDALNEIHIFDASVVEGATGKWSRITDSEYRMLNDLAESLGGEKNLILPDVTGSIRIVSELPYCSSCSGVIHQFNRMFPNVEIILIDGVR